MVDLYKFYKYIKIDIIYNICLKEYFGKLCLVIYISLSYMYKKCDFILSRYVINKMI